LIFSRNSEIRHCRNSSILLLNPWAILVLLLCHLVADSYNSLACLATCHAIADPFEFGYCAMAAAKFAQFFPQIKRAKSIQIRIDARIENGEDVQEILDHWIKLNLTKTTTGGKIQIDKVKSDHDEIRRPADQKRDDHQESHAKSFVLCPSDQKLSLREVFSTKFLHSKKLSQ
ncbi:hypothetical protein T03_5543, partial [Trichinella britovi]